MFFSNFKWTKVVNFQKIVIKCYGATHLENALFIGFYKCCAALRLFIVCKTLVKVQRTVAFVEKWHKR